MAWDDATYDGGTWAEPGSVMYAFVLSKLPPEAWDNEPADPPDTFAKAMVWAFSRELSRLRYALDFLEAQAFIQEATAYIGKWERQLGLPLATDADLADRRDVALARRRGRGTSVSRYLMDLLVHAFNSTADPTPYPLKGRRIVYKLADAGWPGDEVFRTGEARLRKGASAGFGIAVAAHDVCSGLSVGQLSMMSISALSVLSIAEMSGGDCGETSLYDFGHLALAEADDIPLVEVRE